MVPQTDVSHLPTPCMLSGRISFCLRSISLASSSSSLLKSSWPERTTVSWLTVQGEILLSLASSSEDPRRAPNISSALWLKPCVLRRLRATSVPSDCIVI